MKEMGLEERVAVNVSASTPCKGNRLTGHSQLRMLKDFDASKVKLKKIEGMDMKDAPPKYPPFEV